MPRPLRRVSSTNIYHVTSRGAGRRILFDDEHDFEKYIFFLRYYLSDCEGSILAWCLMSNHTHLLLRMEFDELVRFMHRLNTSYAQHYNGRHGHVGPVFERRYDSEPVESEKHLIDSVLYIHQNPLRAGIPSGLAYPWSSYEEYASNTDDGFCEAEFVISFFESRDVLIRLLEESELLYRADISGNRRRLSDAEVLQRMQAVFGKTFADDLHNMEKERRDRVLYRMWLIGASGRQIERLTGIGRNIVAVAVKKHKDCQKSIRH